MKDQLRVGLDLKYWRGQHHWPQQDSRPGLVQLFVRAVEFEEADKVDEHGWRCDAGKHKPSPRSKGWRWHLSPGQHGNHQSGFVEYLFYLLDVACQLILGPMYEHSNYGLFRSCDQCESDLEVFGTCSTEGSSSRQLAARKGRVDVVETPGCQVVMIYLYG